MKDPYRKFRSCIYCGNSPTTKEHIIPKWIGRELRVQTCASIAEIRNSNGIILPVEISASCPITGFTSKSACKDCNTGWMSATVDASKSVFKPLIYGTFPRIFGIEEQRKVYRQFAVTACSVDVETTRFGPVLTDGLRGLLRQSNVGWPFLKIAIGKADDFFDDPYFNISCLTIGSQKLAAQKTITIVIGYAAILISIGFGKAVVPEGYFQLGTTQTISFDGAKLLDRRAIVSTKGPDIPVTHEMNGAALLESIMPDARTILVW